MSAAAESHKWRRLRFIPLGFAAAALLGGLRLGLAQLGLMLPGGLPPITEFHGALMISGFLGTLISLERAVALGRWWAYAAPAVSAVGAVFLLVGAPSFASRAFLLASLALIAASIFVIKRQPALFTLLLAVAAVCWSAGTAAWIAGRPSAEVAGWWLAFLVLTVAAERLELSRLLSPALRSQAVFVIGVALVLVGTARGEFAGEAAPFTGVGLLVTTVWLLTNDIARRTIRQSGQTRFSAACMLAGYFWLAVAGLLLLFVPPNTAAFSYDAVVHAITIGFILSMIFAHAPIILPAVTGLRVSYSAAAYAPLVLLHASILLRVCGDLGEWIELRSASGLVTVLALAGYAGVLSVASLRKTTLTRPIG